MESNQNAAPQSFGNEPYEFTPSQNEVIGDLGNSMKWVTVPLFAVGGLSIIQLFVVILWSFKAGLHQDWNIVGLVLFLLMSVIFYFAMAQWTLAASLGFRAVAETKGKDISYLMIALNNLRAMYSVLAFFVKAFLVISVISLIFSLVHLFRS